MPEFIRRCFPLIASLMLLASLATADRAWSAAAMREPTPKATVIAHRGASALRPEHTLAAYLQAIEDGADAIEPDLVSTRDGFLVARHENQIGDTTDVADHAEFATRKTTKSIDGESVSGWFTEDFTLQELRRLRARERLPQLRSSAHDGQYPIATLEEIIELTAREAERQGRTIGLVPEIKHPSHFAALGLAMEDKLLDALQAHPYTRQAPVTIQSFETANLRYLRQRIGHDHPTLRLLQLLGPQDQRPFDLTLAGKSTTYGDLITRDGLQQTAAYADAIGPSLGLLELQTDAAGEPRSRLVEDAHAAGLEVVVYTFRPENYFLEAAFRDGAPLTARNETGSVQQMRRYLAAGIDALFTDDPALGRRAVDGD